MSSSTATIGLGDGLHLVAGGRRDAELDGHAAHLRSRNSRIRSAIPTLLSTSHSQITNTSQPCVGNASKPCRAYALSHDRCFLRIAARPDLQCPVQAPDAAAGQQAAWYPEQRFREAVRFGMLHRVTRSSSHTPDAVVELSGEPPFSGL